MYPGQLGVCEKKDSPGCGRMRDERGMLWVDFEDGTGKWLEVEDIRLTLSSQELKQRARKLQRDYEHLNHLIGVCVRRER